MSEGASLKTLLEKISRMYRWHIHTPVRHFFGLKAKTDWVDAFHYMAKKMLPYMYDFQKAERFGTPVFTGEKLSDEEAAEKWDYIIDEIVFALEHCVKDDDSDCEVPNPLYNPNQNSAFKDTPVNPDGTHTLEFNEDYGETKLDMELLKKKHERVRNGLKLMGEYFMNLWD